MDEGRVAAVKHFISLWARVLASTGVPETRTYSHIAFRSRDNFEAEQTSQTYAGHTNFSPIESAFGLYHRAGFSTYPDGAQLRELYEAVERWPGRFEQVS